MNMFRLSILAAVLALAGCATCREHPVVCGIGVALATGAIAAAAEHHHDQERDRQLLERIADPGLHTHCTGTPGCNP